MPKIQEKIVQINSENAQVIGAISSVLPQIEKGAEAIFLCKSSGSKVVLLEENEQNDFSKIDINTLQKGDILFVLSPKGQNKGVINGVRSVNRKGFVTICLTFNPTSILCNEAQYAIVPLLGDKRNVNMEQLAIQLIKDMLERSLAQDVKEQKIKQNSAENLLEKGIQSVMIEANISDYDLAKRMLLKYGSVHKAVVNLKNV